ncbi:MAG: FAD binding domain-containing protein [Chloroflexota bacterium]
MSVRDYFEPRSIPEACDLAERYAEDGKLLAGGTALVLLMRQKLLQPSVLVNLAKVPELFGIRQADGYIEIGATATHDQAARSELLRDHYPALAHTFAKVATPRIRHAGTVGGNLAHGDPHLDPPVSLLALDATVTLRSSEAARELKLAGFFLDYYETALRPGEILTGIRIPERHKGEGLAFVKFLPRSQDDYATVDVAVWLNGRDVRIALGSVGPTVFRASEAEELLKRQPDALQEAGDLAAQAADPDDDVRGSSAYKRELIKALLPRVVAEARQDAIR